MTRTSPSIAFLSTYPPTTCGLATFTRALRGAISEQRGSDAGLDVVRLSDTETDDSPAEVSLAHLNGDATSRRQAIAELNDHDVVMIQHEYGIFGGVDGAEVLDIVRGVEVPVNTTLHTVLGNPSPTQRSILEGLSAMSDRLVVMSETARQRLGDRYDVDMSKVSVIPHGATIGLSGPSLADGRRPTFLTWGLIGPGKGLETSIEAFAGLDRLTPRPRYRIVGSTHPKVAARLGETYRDGLIDRVGELGLDDVVEFDGRYLDPAALVTTVRSADVVILPYESTEQVTSGVLVEALGAGKPVIATAFPHAVELLAGGAGLIVPHNDPAAMRDAIRFVAENPVVTARMARRARVAGSSLYWPVVADRYDRLAAELSAGAEVSLARVG